jgi:hypothetical protein
MRQNCASMLKLSECVTTHIPTDISSAGLTRHEWSFSDYIPVSAAEELSTSANIMYGRKFSPLSMCQWFDYSKFAGQRLDILYAKRHGKITVLQFVLHGAKNNLLGQNPSTRFAYTRRSIESCGYRNCTLRGAIITF